MMSDRFVVHHVGGRFGNFPFPAPEALREELELVLYDADADCVGALAGRRTTVLPICLADHDGEVEFRITANPSGSSMLEPSAGPDGSFLPMLGLDWDLEAGRAVVERRRLAARSLDSLLAERGDLPPPDVLTLDAQGGELAVLGGAGRTLERHVAALVVEVQFTPLYRDAPSFDGISSLLAARGFQFARFSGPISALAAAAPIGRRTGGFQVAGDAIFLRRLDRIPDRRMADATAFAALVFGHLEYSLAAFRAAPSPPAGSRSGWRDVLDGLADADRRMAVVQPPRAPQCLPADRAEAYRREADPANWPALWDLSGWRAEQGTDLDLEGLFDMSDTPIEAHLRTHGFGEVADETNLRRRDQAWQLGQVLQASRQ
jgi:FkbM family methyltransferase